MPVYGIYRMILEVVGHDQTGSLFKRITAGFGSILQYATAIVGAMVFERIASGIASIVSSTVEAVAYMQQMDLALTQLSAREMVQTGAATSIADAWDKASIKGDELLARLQDIAILSPYTVESVTQTYKMAMAFGFTTDEAMTLTNALLQNAAGIGADNSMLDRMAYNLAQVRLQGKVTALDIRQLALAGFDLMGVLKYVGKQMGVEIKTHLDFNKAINEGKISWGDFTKYFAQYADVNFGGAAERMARTLVGLKSTFHDVFVLTMPMLFGPAAEKITTFLNDILNKFIAFRESGKLQEMSIPITRFVERVLASLDILINFSSSASNKWRAILGYFMPPTKASQIVDTVGTMWRFITRAWNAGAYVVGEVVDNLKKAFVGLQTFWVQNGDKISETIGKIFSSFGKQATGEKAASWIDLIFTPLQNFVAWLIDNGPTITNIIGKVANFISNTLFPAVTTIITFLAGNWQSIALFFGIFKYGVNFLLGAWKAFSALKLVVGSLGMLFSSAAWPIMLIVGAIALLAVAWQNNWGGIQEKVAVVWAWLQPVLMQIWTWLQVNIPIAVAWLANVWSTVLLPAIQVVWNWISTVLFPVLASLWAWLSTNIPLALQTLANFWTNTLMPAAMAVYNYFATNILPILQTIATVVGTVLGAAISFLSSLWTNTLLPALQTVWGFISGTLWPLFQAVAEFLSAVFGLAVQVLAGLFNTYLKPALEKIGDIVGDKVTKKFEALGNLWNNIILPAVKDIIKWWDQHLRPVIETALRGWLENFRSKFDAISKIISGVVGFIKDLTEKIKNVKLPDWIIGHSPSPFELSLMGINNQLDVMTSQRLPATAAMFRRLGASAPAFEGVGTEGGVGGVTVIMNVDSINSNIDVDRMAYSIARSIQRNRGNG
jgi:tape measure domain-containing protein